MRPLWRRLQRIELGFELAIAGVILELFCRGIRPALSYYVGCGSELTDASDDFLFFVSEYRLSLIIPAVVMLVETQVALRPWVKRAARLGGGLAFAAMLVSYSISVWSVSSAIAGR